jgi:hypothetical protein
LTFADNEFEVSASDTSFEVTRNEAVYLSQLSLPLKGNYQVKNLSWRVNIRRNFESKGF